MRFLSTNRADRQQNLHLEEVAERVPVDGVRSDAVGLFVGLLGEPVGLVSIDDGLAGPEVSLFGLDFLGLVDDLVAEDHDEVERDTLRSCVSECLEGNAVIVMTLTR